MTAAAAASELEVASLIQHRSPDGFLPSSSSDGPQTSALTLSTLLQSRADTQTDAQTGAQTDSGAAQAETRAAETQRAVSEQPQTALSDHSHGASQAASHLIPSSQRAQHASQHGIQSAQQEVQTKPDVDMQDCKTDQGRVVVATHKAAKESGSVVDFLLGQRESQTGAVTNGLAPVHDSKLQHLSNGLVRSATQARPLTNGLTAAAAQPNEASVPGVAAGQGGMSSDQDMVQSASQQAGQSGALSNQDVGTHPEEEAGPSGALPDQDMAQPTEAEEGPTDRLPDQDMTQDPAEEEAGPSSSRPRAQGPTAAPQQRKRKFDSGTDPLVSRLSPTEPTLLTCHSQLNFL